MRALAQGVSDRGRFCIRCLNFKLNKEFHKAYKRCNACVANYPKEWAGKKLGIRVAFLNEYKASMGCVCCAEKDPVVLDFHHRDPHAKEFSIGSRVNTNYNRLVAEVEKCDILCSNCHRRIHHAERMAIRSQPEQPGKKG